MIERATWKKHGNRAGQLMISLALGGALMHLAGCDKPPPNRPNQLPSIMDAGTPEPVPITDDTKPR